MRPEPGESSSHKTNEQHPLGLFIRQTAYPWGSAEAIFHHFPTNCLVILFFSLFLISRSGMSQIPTSELTMASNFSSVFRRQKVRIIVLLSQHYPSALIIKSSFIVYLYTSILIKIFRYYRYCYRCIPC